MKITATYRDKNAGPDIACEEIRSYATVRPREPQVRLSVLIIRGRRGRRSTAGNGPAAATTGRVLDRPMSSRSITPTCNWGAMLNYACEAGDGYTASVRQRRATASYVRPAALRNH